MNCEFCGKEEALPFVCNYCGGVFCGDHRLPEAHQCKGDLSQKRTVVAPTQNTFTRTDAAGAFMGPTAQRTNKIFSRIEVRDIIIAWLGLGFAFSISTIGPLNGGLASSDAYYLELVFLTALVTIGSGFVLHELSHKFMAQRYGYWAEFRMWPYGLVLALMTSLIGFIFAAPGATYISGMNISQEENGKISLAGPLTNVGVAIAFLPLTMVGTGIWHYVGVRGVELNLFLALFNLLPVGPLDGAKVFAWSRVRWLSVFVPLALVFYYLIRIHLAA